VAIITEYESLISDNEATVERTITNLRVNRVVQKIEDKWLIVYDHRSELLNERGLGNFMKANGSSTLTTLGFDVLVHMEKIIGIVLPLHLPQTFIV
jgi:hypothetical protein